MTARTMHLKDRLDVFVERHAGRVHAANDPERALQMYGAHEFGHKVDPGMY